MAVKKWVAGCMLGSVYCITVILHGSVLFKYGQSVPAFFKLLFKLLQSSRDDWELLWLSMSVAWRDFSCRVSLISLVVLLFQNIIQKCIFLNLLTKYKGTNYINSSYSKCVGLFFQSIFVVMKHYFTRLQLQSHPSQYRCWLFSANKMNSCGFNGSEGSVGEGKHYLLHSSTCLPPKLRLLSTFY